MAGGNINALRMHIGEMIGGPQKTMMGGTRGPHTKMIGTVKPGKVTKIKRNKKISTLSPVKTGATTKTTPTVAGY